MNEAITRMMSFYNPETDQERKNAIKEVVQEIILCGLSRGGFFERAAFYGGTALRIFYGLDRFSEDLDFSLKDSDTEFQLSSYLPALQKEAASYGLELRMENKDKVIQGAVQSAFAKGNTKELMLSFFPDRTLTQSIGSGELIKVKFEVDTNPPGFAGFERRYRLLPIPYQITLYDLSSLFSGKIHEVICRGWKNRVKGRDLYDYVFYLSKGAKFNLKHLKARLVQSEVCNEDTDLTLDLVKQKLISRFESIDFNSAKDDVLPFVRDPAILDLWSTDFFTQITDLIKADDR